MHYFFFFNSLILLLLIYLLLIAKQKFLQTWQIFASLVTRIYYLMRDVTSLNVHDGQFSRDNCSHIQKLLYHSFQRMPLLYIQDVHVSSIICESNTKFDVVRSYTFELNIMVQFATSLLLFARSYLWPRRRYEAISGERVIFAFLQPIVDLCYPSCINVYQTLLIKRTSSDE